MPLVYKVNVIEKLKEVGASAYVIRNNPSALGFDKPPFNETALQKIRSKDKINWDNLEMICRITGLQPGDILAWEEEKKEKV